MRTFTRRAERYQRRGPVVEETFATRFGVGRLLLVGGLPAELVLPDPQLTGTSGRRASRWSQLLERYFAGERVDVQLDVEGFAALHGLPEFSRAVFEALSSLEYGEVVSYGELASRAGRPRAHRAVGSVMARNPLPVLLPCHRVVRGDGRLGLFGDDPAWKSRLLHLEGVELAGDRLARGEDQ